MTWTILAPLNIYEKCSKTQGGVVYKLLWNYPDGLNFFTLLFMFVIFSLYSDVSLR